MWDNGKTPAVCISLTGNGDRDSEVDLSLGLRTDDYRALPSMTRTVTVPAGTTVEARFDVEGLDPGFYHAVVTANHSELSDFNFGYDPEGIVSAPDMADDFDRYWENALAELAEIPMDAELTLIPEKSTKARNIYLVEMKSIPDNGVDGSDGPVVIRGYYAEPVSDGKYPALITYQGYDSDSSVAPWCPGGYDRPGYVEFILSTRGQMLNNRAPYENPYGDWFGIRGGAELLLSRRLYGCRARD